MMNMQNLKMDMDKMKIFGCAIIFSLLLIPNMRAQELTNGMDTVSYCVGMMVGNSVKTQVKEVNVEKFMQAFEDVMNDNELLLTPDQAQAYMQAYGNALKKREFDEKIASEKAFLDANAARDEVSVTESGLQYEVLKSGEEGGASPTKSDRVNVHYHGTLINGDVFDSSVDRGEPIEFGVTQVISGWTEVLQLMTVGDKWRVYIPYDLAYGDRDAGKITPYSALIFEIELLDVIK